MISLNYLERLKLKTKEIDKQQHKLDRLKNRLSILTEDLNDDPNSRGHDIFMVEETTSEICELSTELNEMIDDFVTFKHRLANEIGSLKNKQESEVLFKRYVQFKSWEDIAQEMNLTVCRVTTLHARGLLDFTPLI